jgi:transcriptional regulator with XRE-family HTH domain
LTARELASMVGVAESSMSSWRSGKQNIANPHWAKLREILAPYLDSPTPGSSPSAVSPGDVSGFSTVPVIWIARAADYEACLQSVTITTTSPSG